LTSANFLTHNWAHFINAAAPLLVDLDFYIKPNRFLVGDIGVNPGFSNIGPEDQCLSFDRKRPARAKESNARRSGYYYCIIPTPL
jgi:hypothetical protein